MEKKPKKIAIYIHRQMTFKLMTKECLNIQKEMKWDAPNY